MLEVVIGIGFSGLGTALLMRFLDHHSQKQDEKLEEEPFQRLSYVTADELATEPKTEVQEISERFLTIFELMNEGRGSYKRFTKAKLAQVMGLETSDLENVMLGKEEASSKFRSDFCQVFGVNEIWMRDGVGYPFANDEPTRIYPTSYYDSIRELEPEWVYFIRARTEAAEAFIILKLSDWKFKVLREQWHISDENGCGGRWRLLNFYKLLKQLDKDGFHRCSGRALQEEEFDALYRGDKFPGKYAHLAMQNHTWWRDLTDIYHEYPIAKNYEQWYGKSFIKAQNDIRYELEQDKRSQS